MMVRPHKCDDSEVAPPMWLGRGCSSKSKCLAPARQYVLGGDQRGHTATSTFRSWATPLLVATFEEQGGRRNESSHQVCNLHIKFGIRLSKRVQYQLKTLTIRTEFPIYMRLVVAARCAR